MQLAARVPFVLDAKALALGRASDVLAIDASAFGSTLAIRAVAPETYSTQGGEREPRVATVEVLGPIAQRGDTLCGFYDGYDTIAARVCAALEDRDTDAVMLVIDSPGGDAAGMVEGVHAMREAVAAAGKPVFAYVDELAASAAYALATVADKIFVPSTGRVGSIGTASIHLEESRALDAAGVTPTIIRSSPNKLAPNSLEPLTDVSRARMQARVDEMAAAFAQIVVEARGQSAAHWLGLDAAVFSGADAVRAGLADGVATREQVLASAAAAALEKNMASTSKNEDAVALEVGRVALALTGAADEDGAIKRIREWQSGAARAAVLEAETKAQKADEAKRADAADALERVAIVEGMVKAKTLTPANAWASGDTGPDPKNGLHPRLAVMKTKHLRAMAASVEPHPALARATPDVAKSDATRAALGAEDAKKARDAGVKSESLAAARGLNLTGSGSVEV